MSEPIENYRPLGVDELMRRQAWKVWTVAALVVLVWSGAIIAAPFLRETSLDWLATAIYKFFGNICHQMPERSFHIHDHAFAVCTRCSGVYFGLFAGFLLYPLVRKIDEIEPLPRFWLFLAMIPIGIDWSLGVFGIWENTAVSRFITGLILGAACGVFIVPAIVEIVRLMFPKWKIKRPPK